MSKVLPADWIGTHLADTSAKEFVCLLFNIFETWDDLVDKDKPLSDKDISDAFRRAIVYLPVNPFYNQHFGVLYPLVVSTITAWETSNSLHKIAESDAALAEAYTLRKLLITVVVECVRIVHGDEAAFSASLAGWGASARNDPYQTFLGESL